MAMYVLFRFEDDDIAKDVVEGGYGDTGEDLALVAKPVGMYKPPTKFCECTDRELNSPNTRGAKYGWGLHPECGLPVATHGQLPLNILRPEVEAENDPDYKDHVLHIYTMQNVGMPRRKKAIKMIYGEPEER